MLLVRLIDYSDSFVFIHHSVVLRLYFLKFLNYDPQTGASVALKEVLGHICLTLQMMNTTSLIIV